MFQEIPVNVWEDSGKYSRRFQGILLKIPGSVRGDYVESKIWFISWNLACFLPNFAVKLLQNNGKKQLLSNFSEENTFFTTTYN